MNNIQEQNVDYTTQLNAQFLATPEQIESEYALQLAKFGIATQHCFICPQCKTQYANIEVAKKCHTSSTLLHVVSEKQTKNPVVEYDANDYIQTMSVNGQFEYEKPWSMTKRILLGPFFLYNMIIGGLYFVLFKYVITKILPRDHRLQDPRQWPSSFLMYMTSSPSVTVKRVATTWKAVEYIYTWKESFKNLNWFDKHITEILGNVENVSATRNRFRTLKRNLFNELERLIQLKFPDYEKLIQETLDEIVVVSVAAGSARGPIEVMGYFLRRNPNLLSKFKIYLIDNDPESFEFASKLAKETFPGLENRLFFKQSKISEEPEAIARLDDLLNQYKPDIVEMVGFTDYMSNKKAELVINSIYRSLSKTGVFITNNRTPNHEQLFLVICVMWKMQNRYENVVIDFIRKAGFSRIVTCWEPSGIEPVYVARKM